MISSIDNLLKDIRNKREKINSNEIFQEVIDFKEVEQENILVQGNKEFEEFLKDDILYLTKNLVRATQSNDFYEKRNKVFNKDDYKYNVVTNIYYDKSLWYKTDSNITLNNESIDVELSENKYISYLEKNIDFSKAPKNKFIKVEKDYEYKFEITGDTDGDINLILFIISYSNQNKDNVYSVSLNNSTIIRFSDEVTDIRLALRVFGVGKIKDTKLTLSAKKRIGDLEIGQYRDLGFDKPNSLKELKLATICDEFTFQCLKSEVDLITFTPESWRATFAMKTPHILFVESAWQGVNKSWNRKISTNNESSRIYIREVVEWCKKNNIPTVFWNKEDPVHFNAFINTAKLFDYIFTTDENKVSDYKAEVEHNNVYSMQFFAQPKEHNPTKIISRRDNGACFAGSYYAKKYIERQKDMLDLLDITKENGLTIYDRNFGSNNEEYLFPEEFRLYVKGKLAPEEIYKAYKGYDYMINVNSVINSPTMFSRRVFEGLACGTPVISTYSEAIKKTFGEIVIMDPLKENLKTKFREINEDREIYNKKALIGLREVYQKHTIKERLLNICEVVGVEVPRYKNKILVLGIIKSVEDYKKFKINYDRQLYGEKEGVLITDIDININELQFNILKNISELDGILDNYDYITIMNSNDFYGKNYLVDLEIATEYSHADIIGKSNVITNTNNILVEKNNEVNYSYVEYLYSNTLLISKKLFKKYGVSKTIESVKSNNYSDFILFGERLYSIDKYNYIQNCTGNDIDIISKYDI